MSHYRVSNKPYLYDIAEGNVAGHKALNKYGANDNVGGTEETVWSAGGAYTYLSSAEVLQVSSSDAGQDDQGSVLVSSTLTSGSKKSIEDLAADFSGTGVAAGDLFVNDSNGEHAIVSSVTDANNIVLDVETKSNNDAGDSYRIVNANDTGAAVVKIFGLDSSYDEINEYVVMAAAGASTATAKSYLRVFRSFVVLAGSSNANEGIISIKNNLETVTHAVIDAGLGQTLMALWTVPAGKRLTLTDFWASETANKRARLRIYSREVSEAFKLKFQTAVINGFVDRTYELPLVFQEKTDIEMRAISAAVGANINAGFDGYYA